MDRREILQRHNMALIPRLIGSRWIMLSSHFRRTIERIASLQPGLRLDILTLQQYWEP
jgi:hypothetical protein